jgi:hypothetical protein
MINGVLTLARAHSAALNSAPVCTVTVAPPAPPVVERPNPIGVPGDPPPLLLDDEPLTVMVCARVDCVPQLLVYVAVAVQEAVGLTVCVREVPDVPQPLQAQLPPEEGSGAKATDAPEATVALAVCTPLMTAVIVVAVHVPPLELVELEEPEPAAPYEQ